MTYLSKAPHNPFPDQALLSHHWQNVLNYSGLMHKSHWRFKSGPPRSFVHNAHYSKFDLVANILNELVSQTVTDRSGLSPCVLTSTVGWRQAPALHTSPSPALSPAPRKKASHNYATVLGRLLNLQPLSGPH